MMLFRLIFFVSLFEFPTFSYGQDLRTEDVYGTWLEFFGFETDSTCAPDGFLKGGLDEISMDSLLYQLERDSTYFEDSQTLRMTFKRSGKLVEESLHYENGRFAVIEETIVRWKIMEGKMYLSYDRFSLKREWREVPVYLWLERYLCWCGEEGDSGLFWGYSFRRLTK